MSETEMDLGFDPDALREKYRVERDKRLHPDGNEQFKQMEGDFTRYVDDPYVDEVIKPVSYTHLTLPTILLV